MQYSKKDLTSIVQQIVQQQSQTLDLEMSMDIAQTCIQKAKTLKINVAISLCDQHGNAILFYRMPNTLLVSSDLAFKKAYTSVSLNMATHETKKFLDNHVHHINTAMPGLVFFGGGLPIRFHNCLVGGIGISGGTPEQDIEIAKYGLSKINI